MLRATDLVSSTQLALLRSVPEPRRAAVAGALHALLWGEGGFELRFERAVSTITTATGRTPAWPLVTAMLALVHPADHVHVSPLSMRRQAVYMAPRLGIGATPDSRTYLRTLEMVHRIAEALAAARLAPADLWDVHDFITDTLTPSAIARLEN